MSDIGGVRNPFRSDVLKEAHHYRAEWDVLEVHDEVVRALAEVIERTGGQQETNPEQKIEVLLAPPGYGKTHIFGRIAYRLQRGMFFVYVGAIDDARRPLEHIRRCAVESLFASADPHGHTCLEVLLAQASWASFLDYFDWLPRTIAVRHQQFGERLQSEAATVLEIVARVRQLGPFLKLADSMADAYPAQPRTVTRALALGWSPARDRLRRWLRGESLPEEQLEELHLLAESPSAIDVLRAISAMVVGNLPVVICCDQLEAVLQHGDCPEKFANDLVLLLHTVPNLVLVVSCLRDKWDEFLARAPKMFEDRTRQKRLLLSPLSGAQAVEDGATATSELAGRPSWPGCAMAFFTRKR